MGGNVADGASQRPTWVHGLTCTTLAGGSQLGLRGRNVDDAQRSMVREEAECLVRPLF